MSETEINLARAYLNASDQDAVGALIRSIKDLAHARQMLDALPCLIADLYGDAALPFAGGTGGRSGEG